MNIIELLQYDFIQRAVVVAILIAAGLAVFSPLVLVRKMAFFGGGLAHASLAGIAIGLVVSWQPIIFAILFGALLALFMEWLERKVKLAADTLIGIFFAASMALGVIIISLGQGYQPELVGYLFGNILAIQKSELILTAVMVVLLLVFYFVYQRRLYLMALDNDAANLTGVKVSLLEKAYRVVLAIAVIVGVKVIGIVLASALLILPAATAKLTSKSLKSLKLWSFILSEITVIFGLLISFTLDWPSGATIILFGTLIFLFSALVVRPMLSRRPD